MAEVSKDFEAHFWERVEPEREGSNACRVWLAAKNDDGYGKLHIGRKIRLEYGLRPHSTAAVVACRLGHGPKPTEGSMVLHSCDNPACCNPLHLRWGTAAENHAEAIDRGRLTRAATGWRSPL